MWFTVICKCFYLLVRGCSHWCFRTGERGLYNTSNLSLQFPPPELLSQPGHLLLQCPQLLLLRWSCSLQLSLPLDQRFPPSLHHADPVSKVLVDPHQASLLHLELQWRKVTLNNGNVFSDVCYIWFQLSPPPHLYFCWPARGPWPGFHLSAYPLNLWASSHSAVPSPAFLCIIEKHLNDGHIIAIAQDAGSYQYELSKMYSLHQLIFLTLCVLSLRHSFCLQLLWKSQQRLQCFKNSLNYKLC